MSKIDLSYVKFILSSEPTATIILNLWNDEVFLMWGEQGNSRLYYLDSLERDRKNKETWKKILKENKCEEKEEIRTNEMPPEVEDFMMEILLKRNK